MGQRARDNSPPSIRSEIMNIDEPFLRASLLRVFPRVLVSKVIV